jgi:predicted metal-binding membrane protein
LLIPRYPFGIFYVAESNRIVIHAILDLRGMRHMDVGMDMVIMPAMQHWTAWDLVLVFLMWTVMMVAMMVPAASPVILLFAEINRRRNKHQGTFVSTGQFLLGYLTAWTGFSVLATLAQWGLLTVALVSPMMESTSKALGGGLLLGAGLFQFSRLKYACLAHCRSPMGFLTTEWQGGSWGAFRMGLKHGAYCLGCCWALLFKDSIGGTEETEMTTF